MKVRASSGSATLEEARDLTALSVVVEGDRATALGPWGSWVDDDHVAVTAQQLVEWAGPVADEPGWRDGFDTMITYAREHGWVDDQERVRMHVA